MGKEAIEIELERIARLSLASAPTRLRDSILYSLLGPGKRIRPRLVLAVGGALSLPREISMRLATALEMVHAFTLIHDDLPAMDNDDIRRGRPTNHKVYGEALALLAGDSLALLGPDTLLGLSDKLPPECVLNLLKALLEVAGARGVIAGQASELSLTHETSRSPEVLFEIFRQKTGALFRGALTLPAIAAGSPPTLVQSLSAWGDTLGIVFQIADDLEDDFKAEKTNPAHLASYLNFTEARAEGIHRLENLPTLPSNLADALTPFIDELVRKIEGAHP